MDRNTFSPNITIQGNAVATREGGVDRNLTERAMDGILSRVATREGGVDRNSSYQ